jgi:SAM-dependent methyltransferase
MLLERSKIHWDDMGDMDPCWAILSEPGTKFGGWDREEFFATGEREIEQVMQAGESLGLPTARDSALDFGCGIGRLTFALTRYFRRVIGVDISESMLRQAVALDHSSRCAFVANASDRLPFASGSFDLIYTAIVLQHVPQKNIVRRYISEFVRTLKPRGLLVMQIPSHIPLRRRLQARPRFYTWLRKAGVPSRVLYEHLGLHPIPMTFLPEKDVLITLTRNNARILDIVPDCRAGKHINSRTYFATKI